MLYALLVAFGLIKALPLTCIVCTSKLNQVFASHLLFFLFFRCVVVILDHVLMIYFFPFFKGVAVILDHVLMIYSFGYEYDCASSFVH